MGMMSRRSLLARKRLKETPAALGPRLPENRIVTGSTRYWAVGCAPIAWAGHFRDFRLGFSNGYLGPDGEWVATGNDYTIRECALEIGGVTIPLEFSGGRSVVVPDGTIRLWGDRVRPAKAGLNRFRTDRYDTTAHGYRRYKGSLAIFRFCIEVEPGDRFPIGCIGLDTNGLGMLAVYAPANHIEQVDLTGPMTVPTGALTMADYGAVGKETEPNIMTFGPSQIMGRTYDGRQLTAIVEGPSTGSGNEWQRSPATLQVGWGPFAAAMQSADNSLDYVIPCNFATRYGGKVRVRSQNTAIDPSRKGINHAFNFTGQNDIASGGGSTAKQLVDEHIPRIVGKQRAAGARHVIDFMPLPRDTTTDGGATEANQTEANPSGFQALGDYLRRRMGRATAQGVIDLTLGLPSMISPLTPWKWRTNGTPNWLALDEDGLMLHPTKTGGEIIAEEIRWALTEGLAMPRVSRNFAAACLVRPSADALNKLEVFHATNLALGIGYQMFWNLKWPLLGDGSEQARLVNTIWPGAWNLYPLDGSTTITYSAGGTQCNGGMRLFLDPSEGLNPGAAPELSPVLVDSMTLVWKCNGHDGLALWGNPNASSSKENLSANPRNASGKFSARINDLTSYERDVADGNGVGMITRNGPRREGFLNRVSLGPDLSDVPVTGYSDSGLQLFRSIVNADFTTAVIEAAGVAHGFTTAQALGGTDAINVLTA